jgi:hypothetical protein
VRWPAGKQALQAIEGGQDRAAISSMTATSIADNAGDQRRPTR